MVSWSSPLLSVVLALAIGVPAAGQRKAVDPGVVLPLEPFHASGVHGASLVPVRAGDRVLLSSSLRLFALDLHTGRLEWSVPPPAGWEGLDPDLREEFFVGLGDDLLVRPAGGQGVAVARLQLPISRTKLEQYQGIHISVPLPERRLFAFDLASGRELWRHRPPADWDSFSGTFPDRMNVISPPLVAGSRLLAACTEDRSSIDYRVACYDLHTGALIWTTFVARGQVARNWFGLSPREFAAAPLVATGSRVVVQTDLGIVAALDLASGSVVWRAEYEPLSVPANTSYSAPSIRRVWRTAPPVVVGKLVLAAPRDGKELSCYSLVNGTLEWTVAETELRELLPKKTARLPFSLLVGADETRVYLAGERIVAALEKSAGLGSDGPFRVAWYQTFSKGAGARALFTGETLLIPTGDGWRVLDLRSGKELASLGGRTGREPLATAEGIWEVSRFGLARLDCE